MKRYIKSDFTPWPGFSDNDLEARGYKRLSKQTIKAFTTYLEDLFDVNPNDIKVMSLSYMNDSQYGQRYSTHFNISNLLPNFIDSKTTPEIYQLYEDNFGRSNRGSDMIVEWGGSEYGDYFSNMIFTVYDDCPYPVDYDAIDKECEIIDNKIVSILKKHEQEILDLLDSYVLD